MAYVIARPDRNYQWTWVFLALEYDYVLVKSYRRKHFHVTIFMFILLPVQLRMISVKLFMTLLLSFVLWSLLWSPFYVDDTQLYVHLSHKNASPALDKLNQCLQDVSNWMSSSKMEFILFGSSHQRDKLSKFFPVEILGNLLIPTESVKNVCTAHGIQESQALSYH